MISSHGPIPSRRWWGVLFTLISEALDDYQKYEMSQCIWAPSVRTRLVICGVQRSQSSSWLPVTPSQIHSFKKRKQVIKNVQLKCELLLRVWCLFGAVHTDSDGVYCWLKYHNKIAIKIWLIQIWDEMHYCLNLWFMDFFPPTFFILFFFLSDNTFL